MRKSIAMIMAMAMLASSMIAVTTVVSADTGVPVEMPPGSGNYATPIGQDWVVDTTNTWFGANILVQGNLTVTAGASLTFVSCTLTVEGNVTVENGATLAIVSTDLMIDQPGIVDGVNNIYVRTGGSFMTGDVDGWPYTGDESLITSNDTYEFNFIVEATASQFRMVNTELSECGYDDANPGLEIMMDNAYLGDSRIVNSWNGTTFVGASGGNIEDMRYENNNNGIVATNGAWINIDDSWIYSHSLNGIWIEGMNTFASITDTTVDCNSDDNNGIYVYDNGSVFIDNCRVLDANDFNIYLDHYAYANIQNSNIYSASDQGIYIYDNSDADITNNEIFDNNDANIWVQEYSTANIIGNDIFESDDEGIWIQDNSYAGIQNNRIWDNDDMGIWVDNLCNNTQILNNWIYGNSDDGIWVDDSHYLMITGNEIYENGGTSTTYAGIRIENGASWNTIQNNDIRESGYYNVRLQTNSHNNTFQWNTMYDLNNGGISYAGVYIADAGTRDNTFDSNTIKMNYYGIYMVNAMFNTFTNNHIDLSGYRGVYLNNADNNTFNYNTIVRSGGTNPGLYIEQTSGDNTFTYNSFANRANVLCNNGTVLDNTIFDNNYYSDYTGFDNSAIPDWIGDTGNYTIPGTGPQEDSNPRTKVTSDQNATSYAMIDTAITVLIGTEIYLPATTPGAGSQTIPQIGIWYENDLQVTDHDYIRFHGDGPERSFVDGYDNDNVFVFDNVDYVRFDDLSIDNGSGDGIRWNFDEGTNVQIWDTDYNLNPQIDITNCRFFDSGSDGIELNEYDNYGFMYLSDTGDAFQARNVFDQLGNQHIFWSDPWDDDGSQIWYMMTDMNGNVLINGTAITPYNEDYDTKRPIPMIDSQNQIVLVWKDDRLTHEDIDTAHDLFFMRLNPYLDDMDGSPADPDVIKVVDDTQIITFPLDDDGYVSYENELQMAGAAIDSEDNIHLVWTEEDIEDWLYYNKIDRNGTTLIGPEELIFQDGNYNTNPRPDLAIDNNDNLHLIWSDYYMTGGDEADGEDEIFYAMLDKFGNKIIDRTLVSPDDDYKSSRGQVMVDSQNIVHVVWKDNGNDMDSSEVSYTKFNPYLDDMDGDRGFMADMRLVPNKYISGLGFNTDDLQSRHPFAAMDSNDEIHVVWHEYDRDYEVTYVKLDNNGNQLDRYDITPYDLVDDPTYSDTTRIAVDSNNMPHIVWGDDDQYDIAYYNPYKTMYGSVTVNINDCSFIDQGDDGIYVNSIYFGDINLNVNNCLFEDNSDDGIELDYIFGREHEMSTINILNNVFIDDDGSTDCGVYIDNIEGTDVTVNINNNYFEGDDQMDAIYWQDTNADAENDWADIPVTYVYLNIENNDFFECDYGLYIYEFYYSDYVINFRNNNLELIDDEGVYIYWMESCAGTINIDNNYFNQVDDGIYVYYPAYFDAAQDFGYTEDMMRPTYLNFIDNTMIGVEYYGIYVYENYYAPLYVNIDNCHIEGTGDDWSSFYGIYMEEPYYAPWFIDIKNTYVAHGYAAYYFYEETSTFAYTNIENCVFEDVYYGVYMDYPAYYEYHSLTMTDVDIYPVDGGYGVYIDYACDEEGAVFDMVLDNVNIHAYEGYSWGGDEWDHYDYGIYFDNLDYGRTYLTMTNCDITGYGDGGVYAEDFDYGATLSAWIYDCNFEDFPGEFAPSIYIDTDSDEGGAHVYIISCDSDQTYYIYDDDAYYNNYGQYWDSYIYEGWWLDVEVLTGQYLNMSAGNVSIEVYDLQGEYVTGGLTDGTGWVTDLIAYEMVLWSNGIEQNNPFTIVADNGAATASAVVDIFTDTQVTLTLTGDWDADGQNDLIDPDDDNDGVPDNNDAFPNDPTEWADSDGDGIGDNADLDDDNDGIPDTNDTFPTDPFESVDTDGDGIGDNSDWDIDGDEVGNVNDDFPYDPTEWNDMDNDGIGDNTDADIDGDGFNNTVGADNITDEFPYDPSEWNDMDGDGVGDNSDWDIDGDGIANEDDAFPIDPTEWNDMDGDGIGDNADPDRDGDGVNNAQDDFPDNPNEWTDMDNDGVGDNSDWDIDGDGIANEKDDFPYDSDEWKDSDGDGIGDNSDDDIDGDGVPNAQDDFPDINSEWTDTDGDGLGDGRDWDIDGDTVANARDAFPYDSTEWLDTDGDGIGNNADTDDDGDGILDVDDAAPLYFNEPEIVIPETIIPEDKVDYVMYGLLGLLVVLLLVLVMSAMGIAKRIGNGNTEESSAQKPEKPQSKEPVVQESEEPEEIPTDDLLTE